MVPRCVAFCRHIATPHGRPVWGCHVRGPFGDLGRKLRARGRRGDLQARGAPRHKLSMRQAPTAWADLHHPDLRRGGAGHPRQWLHPAQQLRTVCSGAGRGVLDRALCLSHAGRTSRCFQGSNAHSRCGCGGKSRMQWPRIQLRRVTRLHASHCANAALLTCTHWTQHRAPPLPSWAPASCSHDQRCRLHKFRSAPPL
eukprot:COSAG02_NODE_8775_length_2449_cov_3.461702_1_plen_198_part_00